MAINRLLINLSHDYLQPLVGLDQLFTFNHWLVWVNWLPSLTGWFGSSDYPQPLVGLDQLITFNHWLVWVNWLPSLTGWFGSSDYLQSLAGLDHLIIFNNWLVWIKWLSSITGWFASEKYIYYSQVCINRLLIMFALLGGWFHWPRLHIPSASWEGD